MSGRAKGRIMTDQIEFQIDMLDNISIARMRFDIPVSEKESRYLEAVESCLLSKSEPLDEVLCIGLNVIHRRAKMAVDQSNL